MEEVKVIQPVLTSISSEDLTGLVELINQVFLDSESEFWPHDGSYYRTTVEEIASFICKGHLRFAIVDDRIVGMIKVYKKGSGLGCFGMLIVDPAYRKHKIGSLLVKEAENWCLAVGLQNIELELLVANDFELEEKIQLRNWYDRIGYVLIEKVPFESLYPTHADLIQIPSSFEIMRKKLVK